MWVSAAVCTAGFFLLLHLLTPPAEPLRRLESAERDLRSCFAASCAASEAAVAQRQAELAEAMPNPLPGYVMTGAAPFFFLVGTILFAAGKVEDAVKAVMAHGAPGTVT